MKQQSLEWTRRSIGTQNVSYPGYSTRLTSRANTQLATRSFDRPVVSRLMMERRVRQSNNSATLQHILKKKKQIERMPDVRSSWTRPQTK